MITCTVYDANGDELGVFQPKGEKNLVDEAAEAGIDIPFSCHAGACNACAAKVLQGYELLDPEKDGPKYVELEEEDMELMCIAGVDPEKVADDEEYILEVQMLS